MPEHAVDVLVVGGGPAGLSAAVVLGRSRRSVLLVDAGEPRNRTAPHVRGYLGLDGVSPAELVERGREEARRYDVRLLAGRVVELRRAPDLLVARLADGTTVHARRVVVATGLRDVLPPIPGIAERWGGDVLHCPYCHGWEVRSTRLAVHATRAEDVSKAWSVRQWSDDVTLVLDGIGVEDLDPVDRRRAEALGLDVVVGEVVGLRTAPTADTVRPEAAPADDVRPTHVDDALTGIELADGSVVTCDALVVQPRVEACDDLLVATGAEVVAGAFGELVVTDDTGATGVPGVWAAGNVTDPGAQVVVAAASGYLAALAVDHDLVLEDTDRAVAQRPEHGGRTG